MMKCGVHYEAPSVGQSVECLLTIVAQSSVPPSDQGLRRVKRRNMRHDSGFDWNSCNSFFFFMRHEFVSFFFFGFSQQ